MSNIRDLPRRAPTDLRSELERGRHDIDAGRLQPLSTVLADIHGRAVRCLDGKRRAEVQRAADLVR